MRSSCVPAVRRWEDSEAAGRAGGGWSGWRPSRGYAGDRFFVEKRLPREDTAFSHHGAKRARPMKRLSSSADVPPSPGRDCATPPRGRTGRETVDAQRPRGSFLPIYPPPVLLLSPSPPVPSWLGNLGTSVSALSSSEQGQEWCRFPGLLEDPEGQPKPASITVVPAPASLKETLFLWTPFQVTQSNDLIC